MLFEILCAGGCGADPEPIILFFEKVIQLCRIFVPLIILTIGIIKVVKYRKGTKNKERRKKGIILVVVSVIVFFLLTLGLIGYRSLLINREYDETMHCWCSE